MTPPPPPPPPPPTPTAPPPPPTTSTIFFTFSLLRPFAASAWRKQNPPPLPDRPHSSCDPPMLHHRPLLCFWKRRPPPPEKVPSTFSLFLISPPFFLGVARNLILQTTSARSDAAAPASCAIPRDLSGHLSPFYRLPFRSTPIALPFFLDVEPPFGVLSSFRIPIDDTNTTGASPPLKPCPQSFCVRRVLSSAVFAGKGGQLYVLPCT